MRIATTPWFLRDDHLKVFGARIRTLRLTATSLSLREVAVRLGVTAGYLSGLERGLQPRPPGERVIADMAALYGVEADELILLAGRIPTAVIEALLEEPRLVRVVRRVKRHEISIEDLLTKIGGAS